jgi:hypothetical protein
MLLVGWGLFSRHDIRGTLALIPEAPDEFGGVQADRADALFAKSALHYKASGKNGSHLPGFDLAGAVSTKSITEDQANW